ncbi:MAG: formylglycine-generating enzyme family protein [Elusimicrobiota bacterium]|jgi:formylglycine-generating enzyme required for sulfatase activity
MQRILLLSSVIFLSVRPCAGSPSFEQDLRGIRRQVLASSSELQAKSSAAPSPLDALDAAKVGVAATFVPLPPGNFDMGTPAEELKQIGLDHHAESETPHPVVLTGGFELQATEVTQLQYFLVTGLAPSFTNGEDVCGREGFRNVNGTELCPNHPVDTVSWDEARAFIEKVNALQDRCTYRLPTEAEWEYAARGGTSSLFPVQEAELSRYAWFAEDEGNPDPGTHAVATKQPLRGLYDMQGSVWEWVQDFFASYPASAARNPKGPETGKGRVMRGGAWYNNSGNLRSAYRLQAVQDYKMEGVGFRLARSCK